MKRPPESTENILLRLEALDNARKEHPTDRDHQAAFTETVANILLHGKKGVGAFNHFRRLWHSKPENQGTLLDLRGIRLAATSHTIMRGIEFIGCNLEGASFYEGRLENTQFYNVNLKAGDFQGNCLKGSHFRNTELEEATFFRCDMRNCDFSGELMRQVLFLTTDLSRANFRRTRMDQIEFSDTKLNGTDFSGASFGKFRNGWLKQVAPGGIKITRPHFNNSTPPIFRNVSGRDYINGALYGIPDL